LNDVPFDQMLERVKRLPPRSFIFFILLMRDAAGVTLNADDALRRMSEVANAPVNSIFEHQLGLGIVGGRLYRAEFEGAKAARIAAVGGYGVLIFRQAGRTSGVSKVPTLCHICHEQRITEGDHAVSRLG